MIERVVGASLLALLATLSVGANAQLSFSDDFESGAITGWNGYVNQFASGCGTYQTGYGYTVQADGMGGNVANLEDNAGNTLLNVFADYGNGSLPGVCIVTSVYQERTLSAGDAGDYIFNFDFDAGSAPGANTRSFIKMLDPASGFATVFNEGFDTAAAGSGAGSQTVSIDASMAGLILQFGFENTADGFVDSGRRYDNVTLDLVPPPPPAAPAEPIPALPLWGLLGLAGLVGLLGFRRKA